MITLKPFNTFLYGLYLWNDNPYMVLNRLIIPPMGVDWLTYNWWRAITVGMSKYTYSIRLMIVLWGAASKPPNQPPKRWSTVELKPGIETLWQHSPGTTSNYIDFDSFQQCANIYIYILYIVYILYIYILHEKRCSFASFSCQNMLWAIWQSTRRTQLLCAWTPFS